MSPFMQTHLSGDFCVCNGSENFAMVTFVHFLKNAVNGDSTENLKMLTLSKVINISNWQKAPSLGKTSVCTFQSRRVDKLIWTRRWKGSDRTNIKLYVSLWDCICHRAMMKHEILNIWKVSNFYVRFRNCICHRANMKCEI